MVTEDQIAEKINRLKPSFYCLPGYLPTVLIKGCKHWIIKPLAYIINLSIAKGTYPDRLKHCTIVPHYKAGDYRKIENYRPVGSGDVVAKVFEAIMADQINTHVSSKIIDYQHGFMPKMNTITNLACFTKDIADSFGHGQQVDAIFMDFSKAFDSVNYDVLIDDLSHFGFAENACKWILSLLSNRTIVVYFNGVISRTFTNNKGTPQGSPISPTIFNIKINSVASVLSNSMYQLFADDLKIYRTISNTEDSLLLQNDIDNLISWSITNKLYFNYSKCSVVSFHRGSNMVLYQYKMDEVILERRHAIKDLGIILKDDLTFGDHIETIVNRANRNLGMLKRSATYLKNSDSLVMLFNTYIRSILEYGAAIWSPYRAIDKRKLEIILNNFMRFAYFKIFHTSENYNQNIYSSVTNLQEFFHINSLEKRRDFITCCFFKKIFDNAHLREIFFTNIISHPNICVRNHRIFQIPPYINTDYQRNCAIYRFCSLYNKHFDRNNIINNGYYEFRRICASTIYNY